MISARSLPLGFYVPGNSAVHRARPGLKITVAVMFLFGSALWATSPLRAAACVALVSCGYLLARVPFRITIAQLQAPAPLLIFLGLVLWWRQGWQPAVTTFMVLFAAVGCATLLTLTTTVSELLRFLTWLLGPTRRIGVPVDAVAIALSITIRFIPLMVLTAIEVIEAARARPGARGSVLAFGVPMIVRSLLRARSLGEALDARGVFDD